MKNFFTLSFSAIIFLFKAQAVYSPISVTNFNWDAVAETSPSSVTTTGALDGSNYIIYNVNYATLMSSSGGLPNNGLVTSGTRTYQLQTYTVNNMLFLTTGQTDSVIFATPAPFPALSVLAFATEGSCAMNITVRFTDNTTQVFNGLSLLDWFNNPGAVYSNFGRANRTTGAIALSSGNPNLYPVDLNISCPNRIKNVKNIKFQNAGTNPRLCIMAVSGAASATINTTSSPVTCSNGINGNATMSVTAGTPPFTYSWSTSPVQTGATAVSLGVGIYTCTITDASSCSVVYTVSVSQSLTTQPPLNVTSNGTNVCLGNTVALGVTGSATYTWFNNSNQPVLIVTPTISTTYTVSGKTSANCLLTGSISITVNPIPTISLTSMPPSFCINGGNYIFTVNPSGGFFSGNGIVNSSFSPSVAGIGTVGVVYSYTDANNCYSSSSTTTTVYGLPTVNLSVSNPNFCINSPIFTLTGSGQPLGGSYSGPGVSGSLFNPSIAGLGSSTIAYTYTDMNNCSQSTITSVYIYSIAPPNLSISKNFFCLNSTPLQLLASPANGTFTGTGLNGGGLFIPSQAGIGTFTLSYSIHQGFCTESKSLTVTVSDCVGIYEQKQETISVYPNPSKGNLTLRFFNDGNFLLCNSLGNLIKSENFSESSQGISHTFFIEDLPSGIYFLQYYSGLNQISKKIIVSR